MALSVSQKIHGRRRRLSTRLPDDWSEAAEELEGKREVGNRGIMIPLFIGSKSGSGMPGRLEIRLQASKGAAMIRLCNESECGLQNWKKAENLTPRTES